MKRGSAGPSSNSDEGATRIKVLRGVSRTTSYSVSQ